MQNFTDYNQTSKNYAIFKVTFKLLFLSIVSDIYDQKCKIYIYFVVTFIHNKRIKFGLGSLKNKKVIAF